MPFMPGFVKSLARDNSGHLRLNNSSRGCLGRFDQANFSGIHEIAFQITVAFDLINQRNLGQGRVHSLSVPVFSEEWALRLY